MTRTFFQHNSILDVLNVKFAELLGLCSLNPHQGYAMGPWAIPAPHKPPAGISFLSGHTTPKLLPTSLFHQNPLPVFIFSDLFFFYINYESYMNLYIVYEVQSQLTIFYLISSLRYHQLASVPPGPSGEPLWYLTLSSSKLLISPVASLKYICQGNLEVVLSSMSVN